MRTKLRHLVEHGAKVVGRRDLFALVELLIEVEELVGQYLAQLNPLLVKGVNVPQEALEAHLDAFVCAFPSVFARACAHECLRRACISEERAEDSRGAETANNTGEGHLVLIKR